MLVGKNISLRSLIDSDLDFMKRFEKIMFLCGNMEVNKKFIQEKN